MNAPMKPPVKRPTNPQKPCLSCGTDIDHRVKSGLCRPCGVRHCGCGAVLGAKNRVGSCSPCLNRVRAQDPEFRARQAAGLARKWSEPEHRAAAVERARRVGLKAGLDPELRQRRVAQGKWLYANILSRPDVRARNVAAVRASGPAQSETKLAWCPEDLRARYRHLQRSKKMSSGEARQVIEREAADRDAVRSGALDEALNWLRRRAMIMRCDPDGRLNPAGSHWRYGAAGVLSAGEVMERARRSGWVPRWSVAA